MRPFVVYSSKSTLAYRRLRGKRRRRTITCLVCGKRFKQIYARHLRRHGMTMGQYRRTFGLEEMRCEERVYNDALAKLHHTEEELIEFLQRRLASGESLTAGAVKSECWTYHVAAYSFFRYWHEVLLAAGIDPMTVKGHVPFKYWSRKRIHEAIRQRIESGESMLLRDVLSDNSGLYAAAHKYAGGWRSALEALGYDYRQFCRERPKWSAQRVIRCILEREVSGLTMRAGDVLRDDRNLLGAAERYFGSWRQSLRASGIDPEAISRTREWTALKVTQEIRRMGSQGAPLSCKISQRTDTGLIAAAYAIYGSWDNALLASGYDPASVRCRLPAWTRSTIVRAIQDRADAGLPVNSSRMTPSSATIAAYRLFGSWDAALNAAGAFHLVRKPIRWSKELIVKRIGEHHRKGMPLNATAVRKYDNALTTAVWRYFGPWSLALRAAGFDPDDIRLHRPEWTVEAIFKTMRKRAAAGEPLGSHSFTPGSLVNAARRLFGGWPEALAAAGVRATAASSMRKTRKKGGAVRRPKNRGR